MGGKRSINNKIVLILYLSDEKLLPSPRKGRRLSPQSLAAYSTTLSGAGGATHVDTPRGGGSGSGSTACLGCGRAGAPDRCSGCKAVYFCARECQRSAWPGHREQCKRAQRELEDALLWRQLAGED